MKKLVNSVKTFPLKYKNKREKKFKEYDNVSKYYMHLLIMTEVN